MENTGKKYELTFPSDTEIKVVRLIDAPVSLVWKMHVDPELVAKWWGGDKYKTDIEVMDVRAGGKWRYIQTDPNGDVYAFRGEYLEVSEPSKLVNTFEFEPMAGHISTDSYTFEDKDGKTLYTTISIFSNKEDRDGMVASGMESGMSDGFDRFDEVAQELQNK